MTMGTEDYPRPGADTGLGFCYFPDEDHYRAADLERWLPELHALGCSWLVLRSTRPAPVPEAFVRGLLQARIEPVIHLHPGTITRIDLGDLRRTAERYASWGVHYLCVYDKPNLRASWGADWGRPQLVERFVDILLPALQAVQITGLCPVLPPPEPGGQYWDLAFLASLLESLKRRAPAGLFDRFAIGMHNYADSRPLNWGAGGPARWPDAQPYQTPPGSEDHRGYRLFEWYDALVQARLGASLALVSLGDGARLGARPAADLPLVDRGVHSACHTGIAELQAAGSVPRYVLNSAFWILSAAPGDPAAAQAWYDPQARPRLPAVAALKTAVRHLSGVTQSLKSGSARPLSPARGPERGAHDAPDVRASASVQADSEPGLRIAESRRAPGKPLRHYVLLPVFEWGPSDWHWQAAQNYVQSLRASCGFSADEACLAERVTIIGNTQGVSADVEQNLRSAGCMVARVAGNTGTETIAMLNDLARSVSG